MFVLILHYDCQIVVVLVQMNMLICYLLVGDGLQVTRRYSSCAVWEILFTCGKARGRAKVRATDMLSDR